MHQRQSRRKNCDKKKSSLTRKAKLRKKESLHRIMSGDKPFYKFKNKIEEHIRTTKKKTDHIYGKYQFIVNILKTRVLYNWGNGLLPYHVEKLILDYCFTIESITNLIELPHHPKGFGMIDNVSYSIIPTDYYNHNYRINNNGNRDNRTRFGASIGIVPMYYDLIIRQVVQVKLYFTQKCFLYVFQHFLGEKNLDSSMQLLDMIENVCDKEFVTLIGYFSEKDMNGLLLHLYNVIVCDNTLLRGKTFLRVSEFKWIIIRYLVQLMLNINIIVIYNYYIYNMKFEGRSILEKRFDGNHIFFERPSPDFYPDVIDYRREVWSLSEIALNNDDELLFNDTIPFWIEKIDGSWELTDIYVRISKTPNFVTGVYEIGIQAKMREVDESGEDIPFTFSNSIKLTSILCDNTNNTPDYICGVRILYLKKINQQNFERWITSQYYFHPFVNSFHKEFIFISPDEYTGESPIINQETIKNNFKNKKILENGQEFQYRNITYEWNGNPIIEEYDAENYDEIIGIMKKELNIPNNFFANRLIESHLLSLLRKKVITPSDSWEFLFIIHLLSDISF